MSNSTLLQKINLINTDVAQAQYLMINTPELHHTLSTLAKVHELDINQVYTTTVYMKCIKLGMFEMLSMGLI
jgi:hypothetical protein